MKTKQDMALEEILKNNEVTALEEFFTFLRFESISTDPDYQKPMQECLSWLQNKVESLGFTTEIWPTNNHPTLFASNLQAGPEKPTLLLYNHYDVQPVDPIDQWISPPFEPAIRDGEIYARGACDNKGQCFYVLQGIEALLKRDGKLPINIKLCIEGEEEIGSPGLSAIAMQYKEQLQADAVAIVDLGLTKKTIPAVTLGTRGLVYMTVECQGAKTDTHSGIYGGLLYNPLHALVKLLASLRDDDGHILLPGFYDGVLMPTEEERKQISFDFDAETFIRQSGTTSSGGETKFSPLERTWIRPTLEINGITGGYGGPGAKTVIPAKATAKISCRLVPGQDPKHIAHILDQYLQKHVPSGIVVTTTIHPGSGKAVQSSPNTKVAKAFANAYSDVFRKPCTYIFSGGTIAVTPILQQAAQADVVMVGLGLDDDNFHAPNEHFGIDRLRLGALIIAKAIENMDNGDHF